MASRSAQQRTADVLEKLETETDLWVASASAAGDAYVIPLSFYWDGARIILATPVNSRTARNLRRAGVARVALGPTRDVVVIEGSVAAIARDAIEPTLADAHAAHTGFDARTEPEEYIYLLLSPRAIQAWRSPSELSNRVVMRNGQWLVDRAHDA